MQRSEFKKRAPGDASKLRVGIVAARFHEDVTDALLAGALETLGAWHVKKTNTFVVRTAGSFEVPGAALRLIKKKKLHAVVAIGCIVKGETRHDEHLSHAVINGLMRVSLDTGVAIGLSVLTTNSLDQAKERSQGATNHGAHAAAAALEAALSV